MRHFCTLHGWDGSRPCVHCAADGPTLEDQLRRAIAASVSGDVSDIDALFTPTVTGSGPATVAQSRDELAAEIEERRDALAHEKVTFGRVESNGPRSCDSSGRPRRCTPGRCRCPGPARCSSRRA